MKEVKLPEGWEWKRLGDCCNSIRYGTSTPPPYSDFGIPFIRATNIKNGTILKNDLKFISKEDSKTLGKCVLREGNLIIVRSGVNTGDCSYISRQYNGALAAYDLIIELGQTYDGKYFNFLINSKIGRYQIDKLKRRAAQEHLNSKQVSSLEFPVPSLLIQRRIVAILEQAETTKRLRAESDELTQHLLQNVFLKMFGDPVMNEKGWEIRKLGDITGKIQDGTHYSPKEQTGDIPYITAKNIRSWGIDLSNVTYVSKEVHDKIYSRCDPKKGDVIYIKDGVTAGLAKVNELEIEFSMLSSISLIRPDQSKLNSYYLEYYLNYPNIKQKILERKSGSAITRLILREIRDIKVLLPPVSLQNEFALIVEQFETLRETQRQSAGEINALLDALMQKAFTGELAA